MSEGVVEGLQGASLRLKPEAQSARRRGLWENFVKRLILTNVMGPWSGLCTHAESSFMARNKF